MPRPRPWSATSTPAGAGWRTFPTSSGPRWRCCGRSWRPCRTAYAPWTGKPLDGDALHLGRLVDDLYELSMCDLGALSYRKPETDLVEVLSADVDVFRAKFAAKGIDLELTESLSGSAIPQADEHRLSQRFRNLLRSSLQHTDAGGGLEITLDREDRHLLIDFPDTAPGVPAEALPRLFDRLYPAAVIAEPRKTARPRASSQKSHDNRRAS